MKIATHSALILELDAIGNEIILQAWVYLDAAGDWRKASTEERVSLKSDPEPRFVEAAGAVSADKAAPARGQGLPASKER